MNRPPKKPKKLKYPEFKPKCEKSGSVYKHEHEYVKQKNGDVAYFTWNAHLNSPEEPKWVFVGFIDKYKFNLIDKSQHDSEHLKFFIDNIVTPSNMDKCDWLFDFNSDELKEMRDYYDERGWMLLVYYYNYPMSSRGGFVVVDKKDQTKVIAYKNIVMG